MLYYPTLLCISLAVDPCFSLIILIRNVEWLLYFGTTILTPLPNLWPIQHNYLCINNRVYSCKISAIWCWTHVLVTTIISNDAKENVELHWTNPSPKLNPKNPLILPLNPCYWHTMNYNRGNQYSLYYGHD